MVDLTTRNGPSTGHRKGLNVRLLRLDTNALAWIVIGIVVGGGVVIATVAFWPSDRPAIATQPATPKAGPVEPPATKVDVQAEYAAASRQIRIPWPPRRAKATLVKICHDRLRAGLPIGTTSEGPVAAGMLHWASLLSAQARDTYARRCIDLAVDLRTGRESVNPRWGYRVCEPLHLFAAAANLADDTALRSRSAGLFYAESDRIYWPQHAAWQRQVHDFRINGRQGPSPNPEPKRRELPDWKALAQGKWVIVPDPR